MLASALQTLNHIVHKCLSSCDLSPYLDQCQCHLCLEMLEFSRNILPSPMQSSPLKNESIARVLVMTTSAVMRSLMALSLFNLVSGTSLTPWLTNFSSNFSLSSAVSPYRSSLPTT